MNTSDERCLEPGKWLGMDKACLSIVNENAKNARIFSYFNDCGACQGTLFADIPPNSNVTLVIPTEYKLHMYYSVQNLTWCHGSYKFEEHGHYGWNLTDGSCSWYYTIRQPPDPYMPILVAFLVLLSLSLLHGIRTTLIPFVKRRLRARTVNENNDMETLQDSERTPPPTVVSLRSSTRIHSIDTFRGIAILLMIFANNGGGHYTFFNHRPWFGLTVADLVLPWFAWIMGLTLVVSLRTQLRISVSRPRIIMRILRRSLILILFGLLINSNEKTTLGNLRFPGVLQLLSITYLICGTLEAFFMKAQRNFQYGRFVFLQDIVDSLPQKLIIIALVVTHTTITFLLPVPDCPTGYLGPGGFDSYGKYVNCTGGAAGYIDRLVFGNHMYNKTSNAIYGQTLRHDPEGLMNTLSAVLIVAYGVEAGRILVGYYLQNYSKLCRWFIIAISTGLAAGFLCNWSRDGGVVPVSKNMMTLSFVNVTSSFAFVLFAILFYIIDHKGIWSGAPFVYAGSNSIVLYVGHYLTKGHFPWSWNILQPTHASLLYMNIWTTALWAFIAYILYRKNIIITV